VLVEIVFPPAPTATHNPFPNAMPFPPVLILEFAELTPVQEVPFKEYAMEFVPEPTAIHKDPFQNNLFARVANTLVPSPVHVSPFVDVANVFPP
jgi:hypothetical protein